MVFLV